MVGRPSANELNLDGLVGPTHNYAGLAYGNLASSKNRLAVSNPRAAALQGLAKMKLLADMGLKQAVCPPQERPDVSALRRLGFEGTDEAVVIRVGREAPGVLAACSSASSMWMANAATVSPSSDTGDGRVHITPANLVAQFHRSLEAVATGRLLKAIFSDERLFVHHEPLLAGSHFGDEGAANHMRLSSEYGETGVEVFVYGKQVFGERSQTPSVFPARQSLEASEAIARLHRLDPNCTIFLRQSPDLIDAGVFHNDVIAVANGPVLFCHAKAFAAGAEAVEEIERKFTACCGEHLMIVEVSEDQVSIQEAVQSYLFNSQLVNLPDDSAALISPVECRENESVHALLTEMTNGTGPIKKVHYVDTRQSMKNGGGPACLRLRVVLTEAEFAGMHRGVMLTETLYRRLAGWVERRYRDRLSVDDLADPNLMTESRTALDELTQVLELGSIYRFQRSD